MDTIWDLVKEQPITNRLYEMSKANAEAAQLENKAVRTTRIPAIPIADVSVAEGPAYSVTLSEDAVSAPAQDVEGTGSG